MSKRFFIVLTLVAAILLGGVAISRVDVTYAQPTGAATPWAAQFFSDTNFTTLVGTYSYPNLDFTWNGVPLQSNGQPVPGMPENNFSVRFTRTVSNVPAGQYVFTMIADDQALFTVNNTEVINITTATYSDVTRSIQTQGGTLSLQVNFVEFQGPARLRLAEPNYSTGQPGAPGVPFITPTPTLTPVPTRTPLPPIPPGAITATVIRAGVLNIRDAPSLGGNRIGRVLRGETYAIVGRDTDARWFLLQLSGFQGWAWGYYLFVDGNEFTPPIVSGNTVLGLAGQMDFGVRGQTSATVRLRASPTVASTQTGRITWGAFLPVVGRTADGFWYQVIWKNTLGWAYAPFINIIEGDINNVPVR